MPVKGLTLSFYSKYIGRQFIDNTATMSRSLDPWFVNNLGIEYVVETGFFKEIGFQVMVGNIFSAQVRIQRLGLSLHPRRNGVRNDRLVPAVAGTSVMAGITLRL